jgi:putative hydrolase of the HAD superfamily
VPFDAVLCDLDGVLRHWDTPDMAAFDLAYGLPAGTLATAAFARLPPALTGEHTDESWRAAVAADLTGACGTAARARALVAEWAAGAGRIDPVVAELLTRARRRVPVVLVTNATTRLEADLAALGVADLADAVVNSARVGVAKPDPRIYDIAAARAGVPARRCLFVDDRAENIATARALGMTVVHFAEPEDLRRALDPKRSGTPGRRVGG